MQGMGLSEVFHSWAMQENPKRAMGAVLPPIEIKTNPIDF